MATALNVSNSILNRGFNENIDITPMKLQKLIYMVYKKYYQDTRKQLFNEPIEVWRYGPVVRSVYDEFKEFKSNAIRRFAKEYDGAVLVVDEKKSIEFKQALDYVWNLYKNYDGIRLSELTHKQGTAWWKAAESKKSYISNADILEEEFLTYGNE